MTSVVKGYAPTAARSRRACTGSQVSLGDGRVTAYALNALTDRGPFFVEPTEMVYEGQVTGEHRRDEDVLVNPCKQEAPDQHALRGRRREDRLSRRRRA